MDIASQFPRTTDEMSLFLLALVAAALCLATAHPFLCVMNSRTLEKLFPQAPQMCTSEQSSSSSSSSSSSPFSSVAAANEEQTRVIASKKVSIRGKCCPMELDLLRQCSVPVRTFVHVVL